MEEKLFLEFLSKEENHLNSQCPVTNSMDADEATTYYVYVGSMFENWKKIKLTTTSDVLFRACLQFVQMMNIFLSLKYAIRSGDAISIEHIYNIFLPFFHAAGKSTYVEIVLNVTDQYYTVLLKQKLHLLRYSFR